MLRITLVSLCLYQIICRLAAVSYHETRRGVGHSVINNNNNNNTDNYYYHHHHHLLYAGYLYLYSRDKLCP